MGKVDHYSGKGKVFNGSELIGIVHYDLKVYRRQGSAGEENRSAGPQPAQDIFGFIAPLTPLNMPLTLELENGKKLDFCMVNVLGGIKAAGPLY